MSRIEPRLRDFPTIEHPPVPADADRSLTFRIVSSALDVGLCCGELAAALDACGTPWSDPVRMAARAVHLGLKDADRCALGPVRPTGLGTLQYHAMPEYDASFRMEHAAVVARAREVLSEIGRTPAADQVVPEVARLAAKLAEAEALVRDPTSPSRP